MLIVNNFTIKLFSKLLSDLSVGVHLEIVLCEKKSFYEKIVY